MKISYAQFLKEINGKLLSLLSATFLDTEQQKGMVKIISDNWEESSVKYVDTVPINSGIVTVRSSDFYRTRDDTGENSYASRQKGEQVFKASHNGQEIYFLVSDTNVLIYRMGV